MARTSIVKKHMNARLTLGPERARKMRCAGPTFADCRNLAGRLDLLLDDAWSTAMALQGATKWTRKTPLQLLLLGFIADSLRYDA